MGTRRRSEQSWYLKYTADRYITVAAACSLLAFLWLIFYLFFGSSTDQPGTFIPVTAVVLNPLTLIVDHTDSLVGFSGLIPLSDLLIYVAIGLLIKRLVHRLSLTKRQAPKSA